MNFLKGNKWYVITLAIICILGLIGSDFSRNSFDYVRVVMRAFSGTTLDVNGKVVEIPQQCYRTVAIDDRTRYALLCKNQHQGFLGIDIRDAPDEQVTNIRNSLTNYPHADIRDEFIYFAWERAGDKFVGVVDHYIILPSLKLSVSGDDREFVLRLARDISNKKAQIDPIDFGV